MATSFWEDVAPGVAQAGAGMLSSYFTGKDAEKRLQRAQDPMYQQQMGLASTALGRAGSLDPKAMAAERFAAQQALVAPKEQQQMEQLQRTLQARGQGGIASYGAVPGTAPAPGSAPMNPQMAAMIAGQAGARNEAAYNALREGEAQTDRLLNRSGMLQQAAQGQRASNLAVQPRKPSFASQLTGALPGLLGNKEVMGMLGKGVSSLFGGGGGANPFADYFSGNQSWSNMGWDAPSFQNTDIRMW